MGIACVSETLTVFFLQKLECDIISLFIFFVIHDRLNILKKIVVSAVCGLKSEQPLKNSNKVKL